MCGSEVGLTPPEKTGMADPGAHELAEASDSDDHFSDAQSAPAGSPRSSPIPRTRVERVDDRPSHGEVPGTEAYKMREEDAAPDEIAVVADDARRSPVPAISEAPQFDPDNQAVPKTVVEVASSTDGSARHPEGAEKRHEADAEPDEVVTADQQSSIERNNSAVSDDPASTSLSISHSAHARRRSSAAKHIAAVNILSDGQQGAEMELDRQGEDSGDDFDGFEEGDEDADFGDFDDDFQQPEPEAQPAPNAQTPPPLLHLPIPDFNSLDFDDIYTTSAPYLDTLYPGQECDPSPLASPPAGVNNNPVFQTPRSASLWAQLVAPPSLQPPDWIRSRIRRLFLVSLGVPVDLDKILPASKQKKLVLPSLQPPSGSLPRTSADGRPSRRRGEADAAQGLRANAGGDAAPDRALSPSSRRAERAPRRPGLDLGAAEQLCETTMEALDGMTDAELLAHVARVEALQGMARDELEYWTTKTDEKIGDREAFEGVIENLVKHARKVRK